jgi:pimeloyl-ACP methyl ester carboxylesterase
MSETNGTDQAPATVELTSDVHGDGPVVVLLHGITEDARSFDPLIAALSRDRTVVAVDLRGHGRSPEAAAYDPASMAADVHAVLVREGLDADPPLVVGHSMGGLVAVTYAALFPTRGVIDIDQPLDLTAFQAQVQHLEPMLRGDGFEAAITAVFEAMRGPLSDAESDRIESLRRPKRAVVLGVWSPLLDLSTEDLDALVHQIASGVDVPVLALHGIDPGPDYPDWLAARLPSATLEVWPDHGHYPHLIDPERFLARVRAFDPAD